MPRPLRVHDPEWPDMRYLEFSDWGTAPEVTPPDDAVTLDQIIERAASELPPD